MLAPYDLLNYFILTSLAPHSYDPLQRSICTQLYPISVPLTAPHASPRMRLVAWTS